ncbi:MAG: hypothetical protein ACT4PM_03900 [Gemmatimonadales bacterium]
MSDRPSARGRRRSIADLSATEFPDVDPQRFEEWKAAQLALLPAARRAVNQGLWFVLVGLAFLLILRGIPGAIMFGLSVIGWFLYMFLYVARLGQPVRKLQAQAGIANADIRRALSLRGLPDHHTRSDPDGR